jgi:hypothetical protein
MPVWRRKAAVNALGVYEEAIGLADPRLAESRHGLAAYALGDPPSRLVAWVL